MRPANALAIAVPGCADGEPAPAQVADVANWHLREVDGIHTLTVPAVRGVSLTVTRGRLWLTVDGQAQDHVLMAGQSLHLAGPARLRLGALELGAGDGLRAGCALHLQCSPLPSREKG